MSVIRVKHVEFEKSFSAYNLDTLQRDEWENIQRLDEPGWENRYEYESQLVADCISSKSVKTILEIGSGPGVLSQKIQQKISYSIEYHLVDKPFAKKYFEEHNFKGKFFVKDISLDLDTKELLPSYDLIICNDTLEHLIAPSNVLKKIYGLMNDNSLAFISVPNWRMAHQFLYRGLWDYDNVLYLFYIHKLEVINVYASILTTPDYPKLDSEESMPDELLRSWNFYFVLRERK